MIVPSRQPMIDSSRRPVIVPSQRPVIDSSRQPMIDSSQRPVIDAPGLSRTIASMSLSGARRELAAATTVVVFVSLLVDGPAAWLVALCLLVAVAFATLQILADTIPSAAAVGVPVESLIVPGITSLGLVGAMRLVPTGLLLIPALALGAWLLARVLGTEARLLASPSGPSSADRTAVVGQAMVVGFVAFAGVAALVPGGIPGRGDYVAVPGGPTGTALAVLATADAAIAFLLGYRAAALRTPMLRDVVWFALTSAIVVAIGAAALRAMEIPRLLGPALLVVVFFLWDAMHAMPLARRHDARRIWETVLLAVLGLAVVAWSLRLRS